MSKSSFEERLQRIHAANGNMEMVMDLPVRSRAEGGGPTVMRRRRRRNPLRVHFMNLLTGMMAGGIGAVLLLGLTLDSSPWGPGTDLNELIYWPAMGALAAAPLLILAAILKASARPGFAIFALGYLTGLMVPVLL
ncbi:MAG: hypothetical protein AAF636_06785 [Pseudomonadota bacterium]